MRRAQNHERGKRDYEIRGKLHQYPLTKEDEDGRSQDRTNARTNRISTNYHPNPPKFPLVILDRNCGLTSTGNDNLKKNNSPYKITCHTVCARLCTSMKVPN